MPYETVNGIQIHYAVSGEGDALVLLHALGSSCQDWLIQQQVFSQSYTVIAPDVRGHGDSDKPAGPYSIELFADDLAALLDRLSVADAHLLGTSMGGVVAQQLALDSPQRVKSLVLVNTFSHLDLSGRYALIAFLRRNLILRFDTIKRLGSFARQRFPQSARNTRHRPPSHRRTRNAKIAHRAAGMAIRHFNATARLSEISCPTLIISGERDRTVSPNHRDVLHQGIAGSRLVVIPDATHAAHIDQPQAFNRIVLEFLASVSAREEEE
jgi:proline-specific peptidase